MVKFRFNIKGAVSGLLLTIVGCIWNYYTSIDTMWYVLQESFKTFITYDTHPIPLCTNVVSWYLIFVGIFLTIFSVISLDIESNNGEGNYYF